MQPFFIDTDHVLVKSIKNNLKG